MRKLEGVLERMSQWKMSSESRPAEPGFYLVYHPDYGYDVIPYGSRGVWGKSRSWDFKDPTHWHPLPHKPGGE